MFEIAALLAAALALLLGLVRLGHNDVWFDEAISLFFAREPASRLASIVVRNDTHGPLYYAFLKVWTGLLGESDRLCRLPATIAAAITVWLTARLGARLVSRKVGLAAALLLALAPLHIYYAQEIRFYSFVECMATLHVLCLVQLLEDDRGRAHRLASRGASWWPSWIGFVTSAVACLLTFYMSALILVADAACVAILWRRLPHRRRVVSAFAAVLVLFSAWMPWFLWQLRHTTGSIGWIPPAPAWKTLARVLRAFAAGEHVSWTSTVAAASFATTVLVALVRVLRRREHRLLPVACWLLVPLVAGLAISARKPVSLPRYYLMVLPAFFLMVAAGARRVRDRRIRLALGAATLAFLLGADIHYYRTFKYPERWRDAAAYVRGQLHPQDAIAGIPHHRVAELSYYFPGRGDVHGLRDDHALEPLLLPSRRLWLFSGVGLAEDVLASLGRKAVPVDRRQFGALEVRCLLPAKGHRSSGH